PYHRLKPVYTYRPYKDLLPVLIFIFVSLAHINSQSGFEKFLQNHINQPFYEKASLGVAVCDLRSGTYLDGMNAEKWMIPASSLKVITTFTAISVLGKNYQFQTKIMTDGFVDHSGALLGNIYITGGGDPTLGSERIQSA